MYLHSMPSIRRNISIYKIKHVSSIIISMFLKKSSGYFTLLLCLHIMALRYVKWNRHTREHK